MLNQVTLIGRVGKDPEVRHTQSGQAVANFSLATDESYKDRDGEKQQKTEWHSLVAWGKLAEVIQQYVTKGQLLAVVGKLQTRQWEDKQSGAIRYTTEVVVQTMKMLGGGKDNNHSEQAKPATRAAAASGGSRPAASTSKGGYKPAARPATAQSEPEDEDSF